MSSERRHPPADCNEAVSSDLFLSAAHGLEENVRQLLSSKRVSAALSLGISSVEFTAQMQELVKRTLSVLIGTVREEDVAIVSVESGEADMRDITGGGVSGGERITVALSVADAEGGRAENIAESMREDSFMLRVDALLEEGVRTVRWNARWDKPPEVIKYGVNDRDSIGCTAMHWAALNDRVSLMRLLQQEGADLSVPGHTPLHWAALKGHVGAVLFLARAGADVNVKDEFSFTPVTRASQNGHLLAVLGLLQAGADPALCDQEGHNALHWAVYHRQHLVVAWLLQASALCGAIDAADQRGATPLHLAAKKSGREMCRKLLAAGARADLTDADGLVAHEVAAKTGRVSTATFLQRYEALPQRIRRFLVQRGPGNRAHFYIPTANGALALACIFLAYVYYLAVLLPVAWPRNLLAHVLLWTFTPFMYWSYWKSWKADPGQIPPQPLELVRSVADRELSSEDIILAAMAPKFPRAKFSRWFDVYVARYDHDCPWISNVVGLGNIRYFLVFCFTVSVCLTAWDWITLALLLREGYAELGPGCKIGLLHAGLCPRWDQYVLWMLLERKAMLVMLLIYVIFAIFTWVMTISQARQIAQNVTTNELINWIRYPSFHRDDGSFKNPYDRGLVNNLRQCLKGWPGANPVTPRGGVSGRGEYETLIEKFGNSGGNTDEVVIEMGVGRWEMGSKAKQVSDEAAGVGPADAAEVAYDLDEVTRLQLRELGFDDA